ncbi:hypothetical protein ACFQ1L_34405 [Phytohabitans flavus]|uniref:hypothetical protein n=1 Tax=Phytohabitans flavus TaxID=1076124 RepID=UPI003632CC16
MAADIDADAVEGRLTRAERLYAEGRTAEADRLVGEVERRVGLTEEAPRRRTETGDPAEGRERAREGDLTEQVGPPGDTMPATRSRLHAVRDRISAWRDRVAALPPAFGRLRDAVDTQLRSIRERLRRGEHVSESELEGLEGLVASIDRAIRDVTRRVAPEWVDAMDARLVRRLERLRNDPPSADRTRMEAEIADLQRGSPGSAGGATPTARTTTRPTGRARTTPACGATRHSCAARRARCSSTSAIRRYAPGCRRGSSSTPLRYRRRGRSASCSTAGSWTA